MLKQIRESSARCSHAGSPDRHVQIWEYIARDSFDRADKVLEHLYNAFLQLAQTPGLGRHRLDLADKAFRFWTVYSYIIVYRERTPLQIIAVVHGARQLDVFLENRLAPDAPEEQE